LLRVWLLASNLCVVLKESWYLGNAQGYSPAALNPKVGIDDVAPPGVEPALPNMLPAGLGASPSFCPKPPKAPPKVGVDDAPAVA
jgi:hypothetical protein